MDPDANLKEQLELADQLVEADDDELDIEDARRLCELVLALNDWIKGGGFLPQAWQKK